MRIALFGSGSPQSITAFRRLCPDRKPVAVIVPRASYAAPLIETARRERIEEIIEFGDGVDHRLRALRVGLICIASFPYLLRGPLLEFAAINVHMSLLPRHRGVDPIFWTYYCGDDRSGVTVHWLDAGCDSGDIVAQRPVPLPLAKPSRELYFELCGIGSDLLHETIDAIESDRAPRIPQDESQATREPSSKPENVRMDFGGWPVKRAWHFLAGLSDQRTDLIVDPNGVTHRHGRALSWREGASQKPGTIVQSRTAIEVHCRDGVVTLERLRPSLLRRLSRRLRLLWQPKL